MEEDYPLTKEYLVYLRDSLFSGIKTGLDVSIISPPGLGIWSYVLFFINTRRMPLAPHPMLRELLGDIYERCVFLPLELPVASEAELLKQIEFYLNNNPNLKEQYIISTRADLFKAITSLSSRGFISVFLLSTLLTEQALALSIFKLLRSVQKINSSSVRLIFSFNRLNVTELNSEYLPLLKEVRVIPLLSMEDTRIQLGRLYRKFGAKTLSDKQLQEIYELSGGLAAFSKHFGQLLLNDPDYIPGYGEYEQRYLDQIVGLLHQEERKELEETRGYICRMGLNASPKLLEAIKSRAAVLAQDAMIMETLTGTELSLFKLLKKNQDVIVTREALAECIWGEDGVKSYSEWAIDKHLHNLRRKVSNRYLLRAFKKKGYRLQLV